jgi:hypothetical protein
MCLGTTRVSARVKFWITCSGTAWVATRVRRWVTRLGTTRVSNSGKVKGTTQVSNSGKVPGSDSGKESGIVSDKGPVKRPRKNLDKSSDQDKTCKTGRFLCFGVNPS